MLFFFFSLHTEPLQLIQIPSPIMSLRPSPSSNQASFGGLQEAIRQYHGTEIPLGKCGSMHMQHIAAPLPAVWSLVRLFDRPQSYKHFIRSCRLVSGHGQVGSIREVRVMSGLPAHTSTERLDALDEDNHLLSFSIIGGDHQLRNYQSTTTVHEAEGGKTIVVESYVVDVPRGSTEEETCIFANTIVTCNLKSLAEVAERRARQPSRG